MSRKTEPLVPITAGFTPPQTKDVNAEAKRRGISVGEQLRRIVDEWRDGLQRRGLASKLYGSQQ